MTLNTFLVTQKPKTSNINLKFSSLRKEIGNSNSNGKAKLKDLELTIASMKIWENSWFG